MIKKALDTIHLSEPVRLKVLSLYEFGKDDLKLDQWYCSILWCPSQCYMRVQAASGFDHILYLRWRWDDPWGGYIVKHASSLPGMHSEYAEWSDDVLAEYDFAAEDVEGARAKLLEIWKETAK